MFADVLRAFCERVFARTLSRMLRMFADVLRAFFRAGFPRTFSRRLVMFADVLCAFCTEVLHARFRGGL